MKKIAVIAPNRMQFEDFLREVRFLDREKFHHVREPNDARGRDFSHVIAVGEYWTIRDFPDLEMLAEASVRGL